MKLSSPLRSATRPVSPAVVSVLERLQPGERIRITQTVRVGQKQWQTTTEGAFRGVNYLATGLSTQRVPEDDIIVPTVHFTKDNGELSSITLDEHSRIEVSPNRSER
jgi:hypothetical protein